MIQNRQECENLAICQLKLSPIKIREIFAASIMGFVITVIAIIAVLSIIGLGVGTFFTGVLHGAQKVGSNPVVQNATGEAKQYILNETKTQINQIADQNSGK